MIIIGLTGGIGAGKSTAAKILAREGLAVYDADRAVHTLLAKGGAAVPAVKKLFPAAVKNGAVDRKHLGRIVFNHPAQLRKLEKILHPLVRKAERAFLTKAYGKKVRAAVLEIPLLFETGGEKRCDLTILVTAPLHIRKARALERRGMSPAKFRAIVRQQMTESEKRRRADHVVPTGKGLRDTKRRLLKILARIAP